MVGYKHRSHCPPFWLLDAIEKDWNFYFGSDRCSGFTAEVTNSSVAFRHDTSRQNRIHFCFGCFWLVFAQFQGK